MRTILITLALLFAVSVQAAELTWQDNSDNEDGFHVYKAKTLIDSFEKLGSVGAGITTFEDIAAAPGNCYRVTAFNKGGESQPTGNACLVLPVILIPVGPGGLTVK